MAITQLNQLQIAYKKLLGKSHVSPLKDSSEEAVPSFVQSPSSIVFGQTLPSGSQIPTNSPANLYQTSSGGIVELVRFELTALGDGNYTPTNGSLSGTTIDEQGDAATAGNHAYALRISGSYNARSNNPRKNTGLFTDGGSLTGSAGSLQLVPPAFGALYSSKVYKSDGSTQIPAQDDIDWNLDYSTGVLFTQDFLAGTIPAFVDAFLYIGKYTNEVVADLSASLQSVAGTNAYATMSVGGVAVIADNTTGNLTIASGSFGGAATTNNNLLISASAGNDTITFSLVDSPRFTHITASGNISSSGNLTVTGNSTIGGTLGVTGLLSANGALTTTNLTASGNISASGNIIVTGDIAVNGGDITTNQTSFNLLVGATETLTIGAAATNVTIPGNLIVNGDTTVINTSTLSIEDKFIVLGRSSGSQGPASEGGIIIEGAAGSGSAFVFNSGSGGPNGLANRWGVALGVPTGSMNVTPTDFMVTVSQSSAAPSDANAPTFGSASFGFGNMHIQDNGEIWIYS